MSRAAGFFAAEKRFRICPRCPYYCRDEEAIAACPWCRVALACSCACGCALRDPAAAQCDRCGRPLRLDQRLEETAALAAPAWVPRAWR